MERRCNAVYAVDRDRSRVLRFQKSCLKLPRSMTCCDARVLEVRNWRSPDARLSFAKIREVTLLYTS